MQPSPLSWRFGWWLAWRDRRSLPLRLMVAVLVVTVASISAVGFLAKRVESALFADAQASLGADRLLVSDRPWPESWQASAQRLGLQTSRGAQFPSMVLGPTDSALVAVKAVEPAYPLRGRLQVEADRPLGLRDVYLDQSLGPRLGVKLGDQIDLGRLSFRVSGWILQEPDRGLGFVNFSPRVLMRLETLQETGLQTAGSRISYRLWVSGEAGGLSRFDAEVGPLIEAGQRFETLDNARPALKETLTRAQRFLGLSGMVVLLMSSVSLALAARQMAQQSLQGLAVLKATGATARTLQVYWLTRLGLTTLLGTLLGLLLGLGFSTGLAALLSEWLGRPLPFVWNLVFEPSLQALCLAIGMVALLAWPAVSTAIRVSPVVGLRGAAEVDRQGGLSGATSAGSRRSAWSRLWPVARKGLLLLTGLAALLWVGSGDGRLGLAVGLGFAVLAGLAALLLYGLFSGLAILLGRRSVKSWTTYALEQSLRRRRGAMVLQGLGLTLALGALGLLIFLRADLLDAWGRSLPQQAPNRFVLNILPDERSAVETRLKDLGVKDLVLYPMVRGRLVSLNDRPIGPDDFADERAKRQLDRELNLSYAESIPPHNQLVEGRALRPDQAEVSVEQSLARSLGLALGDRLGFDVAGESVVASVTSIRALRWDSMAVNFFMVLSPSLIQDQAQTLITSFYVSPEASAAIDRLAGEFPSLTVVNLESLLAQLRQILDQTGFAIQSLFLFSLLAGGLILVTALSVSKASRLREAGLLRALGASRQQLRQAQQLELLVLGAVAGLAAALWSQAMGWAVAQLAFDLQVGLNPARMGQLMMAGMGLAWLGGWLVLREVSSTPSMNVLRQATG
ncbi:MAG: hypothetical protein RL483_433 [Pseudomonadota bacterium]